MRLFTDLRARLFGHPDPGEQAELTDSDASADAPAQDQSGEAELPDRDASVRHDTTSSDAGPAPAEDPADEELSAGDNVADALIVARQERAAGRILDDERIRGDLTDDEFQPLLDWALSVADRLAAATAGQDDASADRTLDERLHAVRDIVEEAGHVLSAHVEGDADRVHSGLQFIGERWGMLATAVPDEHPDNGPGEHEASLPRTGDDVGDTGIPRSGGTPSFVEAESRAAQWPGIGTLPIDGVNARLSTLADRLAAQPDLAGSEIAAEIVAVLTIGSGEASDDIVLTTEDGVEGLA